MRGRKPRVTTTLPVRTSKSAKSVEATSPKGEAEVAHTYDSGITTPASETPSEKPAISTRNALLPVIGGFLALALAGWGEAIVESGDTGVFSLLLYLAAIGIFGWSATLLPRAPGDMPSEDTPPERPVKGDRATWIILGAGMGVAVLLDVATFFMLRADLKSETGKWLWIISLVVTMATGIALHRRHSWPARWMGNGWPRLLTGRTLVIAAIVVIAVAAVAARFLALDTIPLGINADEGDRAATSIQILRQTNTESVFGNGWYQISMMYFTLLAGLLKVIGIGYVQARVFGVIASLIACGMLIWIGARHFNWRVGLMAGGIFATLGIALQFARETSESGPTAALWAISMAFFFEAARTGRMWAWAGAGLAGGFSIYFYPTGRLWAALAAIVCVYLFVHGLNKRRLAIARGIVVAAIAGIIVITPFAVNILRDPNTFTIRAQETSIFSAENPTRLSYYKPEWSLPQLLVEQTIRGVGAFNQFLDNGGFWPTDKPILNGVIAVLFLLGLGWLCLKIRDPRYAMLAAWFWMGLIGVIVTVETPNYQRMGTAIPTLALIPALVLDSMIRRVQVAASRVKISWTSPATVGATAVAALLVIGIGISQATFYFNDYGKKDRYPQPTVQGKAVRDQGTDTLTVTMGSSYHMINSGWIQLLAPETPRGGMRFPGSDLPMATPADTNLAFMVYPVQKYYLPYLQDLYPTGVTEVYTHPTENTIVTIYRISQTDWAAQQGATAQVDGGSAAHVASLGALPPGITTYPAKVTWTSGLRIPAYWNYVFRAGPGPVRFVIDGREVLTVPAGTASANATVALAAGDHVISYEGTVESADKPPSLEWAQDKIPNDDGTRPELLWSGIPTEDLFASKTQLNGLYGVVQVEGKPEEHYLSNAVAQCCLNETIRNDGKPYTVNWTGNMDAPATGLYTMTLTMHGTGSLTIDGKEVIRRDEMSEQVFSGGIELDAGKHEIALKMQGQNSRGDVELRWTPPDGIDSIVPTSALTPPPDAVVPESPLDLTRFRDVRVLLQHNPIETIR